MDPPLFEDSVPPTFKDYHLRIRGWIDSDRSPKVVFSTFLRSIDLEGQLRTKGIRVQDRDIAYVQLEPRDSSSSRRSQPDGSIENFCWATARSSTRHHVERLTTRSLLGLSPISTEFCMLWREAIFKTALNEGPAYLRRLMADTSDHIPDWAIVLSFSMISGMNIAGLQVTPSRDVGNIYEQQRRDISTKIVHLFGRQGISTGADFLNAILDENKDAPDLSSLKNQYEDEVQSLESQIKSVFGQLKCIRAARRETPVSKEKINEACNRAMEACFYATLQGARTMLANRPVFKAFVKGRLDDVDAMQIGQNVATVALLTNAVVSCQLVWAPMSWGAVGTFITSGSWPMVFAHPAGIVASAVGLAILAIARSQAKETSRQVVLHGNLVILIARCCNAVNESSVLLTCIHYLGQNNDQNAIPAFLDTAVLEDAVARWEEFVEVDNRRRETKRSKRGANSSRPRPSRTGLNRPQRQVSRWMRKTSRENETKLRECMRRLDVEGRLDPLSDSDLSGDSD